SVSGVLAALRSESFEGLLFRFSTGPSTGGGLAGGCAPSGGEVLGAAQRQSEDRVGRVGATAGWKDTGAGQIEIRNFMGLAIAVDNRVASICAHKSASHKMNGRHSGAHLPDFLGTRGMADFHALLEIGMPQRCFVLIIIVNNARERHAEFVLLTHK